MPSKNAIKVTIGKESTAGTSVAPTAVIPIKATPKLDRKPEKIVDPVKSKEDVIKPIVEQTQNKAKPNIMDAYAGTVSKMTRGSILE